MLSRHATAAAPALAARRAAVVLHARRLSLAAQATLVLCTEGQRGISQM